MTGNEIIKIIEQHYPLSLQEEWDKCGLQIGDRFQEVNKIMISLNADLDSLDEAIKYGCQMLITHHPFLLDPIVNIDKNTIMGEFIFKAIQNNVLVYSSHTALDNVSMNQWLIERLGVHDIEVGDDSGITRIATLNEAMNTKDFIKHVQNVYHIEHLKYAGNDKLISKVAICGGSGSDFMELFYGKADAYLTGDTKYNIAKNAIDNDILLVDINHHAENIMVDKLKESLETELDIEIIAGSSKDYYNYV